MKNDGFPENVVKDGDHATSNGSWLRYKEKNVDTDMKPEEEKVKGFAEWVKFSDPENTK